MMPRVRTDAEERTRQNHKLVAQVAGELGVDAVTVKMAQEYRRQQRAAPDSKPHKIKDRDIDLSDVELEPIGVAYAQVEDYKILRGQTCTLSLATSTEFKHLLADAAAMSRSDLLVVALFKIPRNLGLEDEDSGDED